MLFRSSTRKLNIDNAGDQAMKTFYQESLREEQAIDNNKVARVYSEAGVALPELVLKRLGMCRHFTGRS